MTDAPLTTNSLSAVIDHACDLMQAAKRKGDMKTAIKYFRQICRLQGLLEQMAEGGS